MLKKQFSKLTPVCQQSVIQKLSTRAEVRRDVRIWEIIHLDAHIGDVHALVEQLARVDAGAVSGVHNMSDAEAFETGFVHSHGPAAQNRQTCQSFNRVRLQL